MGQEGKDELEKFKAFWARYNANKLPDNNKIHPEDLAAIPENHRITISSSTNKIKGNYIIANERPDPCCGDIENAKFVILSRNPDSGIDIKNFNAKAYLSKKEEEQRNSAETQNPNVNRKSFDYLYNKKECEGAWGYWNPKFQVIIKEYAQKLGIKYPDDKNKEKITKEIAKKTCLLESVCYASNSRPKTDPKTLQSSLLIENLLHKYLIPKAKVGKILIFSWRGSEFWDIEKKYINTTVKEFGRSPQNKRGQKCTEIQQYIGDNIIIRGNLGAQQNGFIKKEPLRIAEFLIKAIREDQQNT